jgi:hypothetical protein
MGIDDKILAEITRFKKINKYISEQAVDPTAAPADPTLDPAADPAAAAPVDPTAPVDPAAAPVDPAAADPAAAGAPAAPAPPVDVEADADVEVVDDEGKPEKEELEITDLVDAQKSMKEKQDEYFDNLFNQLKSLEDKLTEMDQLVTKIDGLETKIEKMRPKTSKEKLELRTLDSGPFNQKLSDFFNDKEQEFEKTGKEYVLTADDVENYTPRNIEDSFDEYLPKATDFTK